MTKEIWATVLVAIAQIIASVLIAWWQISKTTKATENPEKNQQEHKTNLPDKIVKYLSKIPLHIIGPFIFYILITAIFIQKQIPLPAVLLFTLCWIMLLLFQVCMLWILQALGALAGMILKHDTLLRCHDTMLFDLTEKPCAKDGVCKFDV